MTPHVMPLFTPEDKAELLGEDALAHPRKGVLLEVAQMRVLNLFREECRCRSDWDTAHLPGSRPGCPRACGGPGRVALRGYAGAPGAPDYKAMEPRLKRALQLVVAGVAGKAASAGGRPGGVKRERRGERTIEYFEDKGAGAITQRDLALLRPFDERAPLYSLP